MKDKFLFFSWIERGTANKTNSNLLLFIYLFFSVSFFTLFTMDLNWTTGSAIQSAWQKSQLRLSFVDKVRFRKFITFFNTADRKTYIFIFWECYMYIFYFKRELKYLPNRKTTNFSFTKPASQYWNLCMGLLEIYFRTCLHC